MWEYILFLLSLIMKNSALALIFLFVAFGSQAQKANWQNLDLREDSVFGISTEKAYRELLVHKKATTVLVAVIDGGVDTSHEDLKAVIWTNPGEIAGNGKDDDHNGYADDLHGWDFIGGAKGDVHYDNLEMVRIIRRDKPHYDSLTEATAPAKERAAWEAYQKMVASLDQQLENSKRSLEGIGRFSKVLDGVVARIGKDTPTLADFEKYIPLDAGETQIRQ